MKSKKILLALPMVAILASCSGKIEVYRDIFKDARNLSEESRQEILDTLAQGEDGNKQYRYDGQRTITTYIDGDEMGSTNASISVEFDNDPTYGSYGFTYSLDMRTKYSAYYEPNDDQWVGTTPDGMSAESLYKKFQNLIYSWNGHVLVGNFDVAPYDYNTKLLNCVSAKFTKKAIENKKVAKGNFTFSLDSAASYTDGEIKHQVNRFSVTYANHRITSYTCNYQIIVADAGVRIDLAFSGTFDSTYIH